ncbi:MAG: SIR2 family protein [Euryarchaeota archaeon]|nr:SIR2 family protein [Euryarchaeota archaeon]
MASKVLIFLGAGASKPFGIPTTKEFVGEFAKYLKESKSSQEEIELYRDIEIFLFNRFRPNDDLENILTVLSNFASDITVRKLGPTADYYVHRYYAERLRGKKSRRITLDTGKRKKDIETAKVLADKLKKFVWEKCYSPNQDKILEVYDRFFERIAGATPSRQSTVEGTSYPPCEIFTTNYDLCVETYCKIRGIEINRGIEHDRALQYSTLKFENYTHSYNVRLFKLHGSIDLYKLKSGHIIQDTFRLQPGAKTPYGDEIVEEWMVYPVQEKYIYQEPFFSMFSELKKQLEVTAYWIVVGHSFRDDAIKNIFVDAQKRGKKIVLLDKNAERIVSENLQPISKSVKLIEGEFESKEAIEALFEILK